jgi:hypothetical protein
MRGQLIRRAGVLLGVVLLTGCALLGPDHQTPTTELSATFANAGQAGLAGCVARIPDNENVCC